MKMIDITCMIRLLYEEFSEKDTACPVTTWSHGSHSKSALHLHRVLRLRGACFQPVSRFCVACLGQYEGGVLA